MSVDLQTKKQKRLEGGTAVHSVRGCSVCNVACNGEIAFADHMAGKKHLAQFLTEKALANTANPKPTSATKLKAKPNAKETKIANNAGTAWCEVCKIGCTSNEDLEVHMQGKKHKKNLEKLQNPKADSPRHASTATKRPSTTSKEPEDVEMKKRKVLESGTSEDALKTCTVCNVVCNSETVFNDHLIGRKHVAMVKRKEAEGAGTADVANADADGEQPENGARSCRDEEKADSTKPPSTAAKPPSTKSKEPEDVETKKRKFLESGTSDAVKTCNVCNVVCNSETVFNDHLTGQKHAAMVKRKEAEVAGTADVADADADADGKQPENGTPAC